MRRAMGLAILAFLVLAGGPFPAASYPSGPVTVVVPFAAGGPLDIMARLLAERFRADLGQPLTVENRTGAAGNIGAGAVAQAKPDGQTLLLIPDSVLTLNPHLYASLPFDAARSFRMIALLGTYTQVLVVHPSFPATNLQQFIAEAKRMPPTYASAGNGSPGHLAFEYLANNLGVSGTHVPYRGSAPLISDLLAGHVPMGFTVIPAALEHVRSGRLRALVVSSPERSSLLPDVPTVAETIPGFDVRFAYVLAAPAETPDATVEALRAASARAFAEKELSARLSSMGIEPVMLGPQETQRWVAGESEKWGGIIRTAKIKGE